jgi:hypothetical protein
VFRDASSAPQVTDAGDRWVWDGFVYVLRDMDVQAAVKRLQLEIRNGIIELDLEEGFTNGLVDAGTFVALVSQLLQVSFQRVGWRVSVIA